MPQLMSTRTGRVLGSWRNDSYARNSRDVCSWVNPDEGVRHLSTQMSRGTVFTEAQARAKMAEFPDLVMLDPHGLYDHQPRK